MATHFLDLDAVRQPVGEVQIGGQTYTVWPIKVHTVINLSRPAGPKADGVSLGHQLEQTITILQQLIPDVSRETLGDLSLEQLNALLSWAREAAYGVAEKNSPEPAPEAPPETAPTQATAALTSPV